jgi:hypothetical protein
MKKTFHHLLVDQDITVELVDMDANVVRERHPAKVTIVGGRCLTVRVERVALTFSRRTGLERGMHEPTYWRISPSLAQKQAKPAKT